MKIYRGSWSLPRLLQVEIPISVFSNFNRSLIYICIYMYIICFRDWSRFRSTREIHVTCAVLAKVRRNFARWAPRTETYGLIWKSSSVYTLIYNFGENTEKKKSVWAWCHRLWGPVRSSGLDTRDKKGISISFEDFQFSTIGFKCFDLTIASAPSFSIRRQQAENSIKESRIETRVVEIADDSNKTNFLRELAIETKKNLQTDAPYFRPRGRIMK